MSLRRCHSSFTTYLKTYWADGFRDRASFRGVREFFRTHLSLFDYELGIQKTRETPVLTQINYKRMLVTYEAIEEELSTRHQDEWGNTDLDSILPSHLGANVVAIFNTAFLGFMKFRRDWRFDFGAVIHEDQMQHDCSIIETIAQLPIWNKFKSWFDIAKDYRQHNKIAWNAITNKFERYTSSHTHLTANTA